jgi:hypothetical protein
MNKHGSRPLLGFRRTQAATGGGMDDPPHTAAVFPREAYDRIQAVIAADAEHHVRTVAKILATRYPVDLDVIHACQHPWGGCPCAEDPRWVRSLSPFCVR